jgi:hypothetical protein
LNYTNMPLDNIMWSNSDFKRRCVGWELQFILWPRRCHYTGKILWLTNAYYGTAFVTGPGEPVFEHRWCERKEFLFQKIKGTI